MSRSLLISHHGQLGRELHSTLACEHEVHALGRNVTAACPVNTKALAVMAQEAANAELPTGAKGETSIPPTCLFSALTRQKVTSG